MKFLALDSTNGQATNKSGLCYRRRTISEAHMLYRNAKQTNTVLCQLPCCPSHLLGCPKAATHDASKQDSSILGKQRRHRGAMVLRIDTQDW